MRARCLAVLRHDMRLSGESLNSKPFCVLDNESDLLRVMCDPVYNTLNQNTVIVDDNSLLAGIVLQLMCKNNNIQLHGV